MPYRGKTEGDDISRGSMRGNVHTRCSFSVSQTCSTREDIAAGCGWFLSRLK